MKKLQAMIPDELMKKLKIEALEKEITLKDLVATILEEHLK